MRTPAGWVPARPGCSGTWLTFRGRFPRHSGASPSAPISQAHPAGAGAETTTGSPKSLSAGASRRPCPARSVRCRTQTFRLEFSLMCFIWGVRGGGTRRGNCTSREGEGTARQGSKTSLNKPTPLCSGQSPECPLVRLPSVSRGDFRRGRVVPSGKPEAAGRDGKGGGMRKDPYLPYAAPRVGYPGRRLGAWGPGDLRSTFSPSVRGCEGRGGRWGREEEPLRAGRRQVLAPSAPFPNATGKLPVPLRCTSLAWEQPDPVGGPPGFSGSGLLRLGPTEPGGRAPSTPAGSGALLFP